MAQNINYILCMPRNEEKNEKKEHTNIKYDCLMYCCISGW